jgi:hypothetical protein
MKINLQDINTQEAGRSTTYTKKMLAWYDRSSAIPLVCYTIISFVVYRLMGPPILILIVPFGIAYAYWFAFARSRPVTFGRPSSRRTGKVLPTSCPR